MPDLRPFPPSHRRRALARQAGLHAASPLLAGGIVCAAAVIVIAMIGAAAASRAGAWIEAAARLDASLTPSGVIGAVLELAAPLAVLAIVAFAAHAVQARGVWMPRRRIVGAPALPRDRGLYALAGAAVIGVVAFAWLWFAADRLTGARAIASALATFAIAWVALGVVDALLRHHALANALHMTAAEKREDERLSGLDRRWRRPRDPTIAASRTGRVSIDGATLLLLGDDVAVAIAWDPVHRPIPTRTAVGRAARATQLLGLARRRQLPVHRDADLARMLAIDAGPVHERHWARLAEIIAAVKR